MEGKSETRVRLDDATTRILHKIASMCEVKILKTGPDAHDKSPRRLRQSKDDALPESFVSVRDKLVHSLKNLKQSYYRTKECKNDGRRAEASENAREDAGLPSALKNQARARVQNLQKNVFENITLAKASALSAKTRLPSTGFGLRIRTDCLI